ncbi:hypothetical protein SAMN05443144_11251 [Fodinibius roseus]|uniref:Uncharacterized protein n=1 Tax=Fodinibius roseus TaxID=1194090 RepID=A0A1M5DW40_9BACT|nr:hypothetical protein [Fodinibius roseus]SHF71165.1 hypothetical protein SAMN05443144_11251 [Fodinibius roseus]
MSNKLKTLSVHQLESLISDAVGEYIDEDCSCQISNLDTPNIDSEADIAIEDERKLRFDIELSYREE